MNLILNAAEAMEGKGTLTLTTRRSATPGCVEFQVIDTGCGIPEEIRSRVFEPFFTTKEVGKGTGLGLSMAYGIVERHGGKIHIDSKVNEGTTFTVRLPIGEGTVE
jgi:signal transduction histidine kinase